MLAQLLGWPQGTFASEIKLDEGKVTVTREVDGGLETDRLNRPCVLTTDLRLNEPRYASLPNIMKAKQKEIVENAAEDFGINLAPRLKILRVEDPPKRQVGIKVESVSELVSKLKEEGVI